MFGNARRYLLQVTTPAVVVNKLNTVLIFFRMQNDVKTLDLAKRRK